MWPMMSYVWSFCSSWIGGHTCKVSPQSIQLFQRRFLKVFMLKTIWLPNYVTDDVINFFSVHHFILRWPSKMFILIRCGILPMQLWLHNEGTNDISKNHTYSPWVLATYNVSIFFFVWFQRYRGTKFFRFSNMAATPCDQQRYNYDSNILHE